MDEALLLLRVALGLLLAGHACQKLFGWFRGAGIAGTAPGFEAWGLKPGKPLVLMAGATELTGAALFALGFLTPLAVTMILGTMIVAASVNLPKGLWAHMGGYEVPVAYALIAFAVCVAGPGSYSLDRLLGLGMYSNPLSALAAVFIAAAASIPLLIPVLKQQRTTAHS
ncbi:DoxX family protein [Arthrobacter pigmenti]